MKPCRRLASRALVLAVPVFACLQATPAQAAITVTGDVTPSYNGTDDPWNVTDNFISIAESGDGSILIDSGSVVNVNHSKIGINNHASNFTGEVTVTGPGSTLNHTGQLRLGGTSFSTGVLIVEDGGHVYFDTGRLAMQETPSYARLSGAGSLMSGQSKLSIGRGDGYLSVQDGAKLYSPVIEIAATTTVSGAGSMIESDELLVIANTGIQVTISDGAQGKTDLLQMNIEYNSPATYWSDFYVTGPGSVMDVDDRLLIGGMSNSKRNNRFNVNDGGVTNVGSDTWIYRWVDQTDINILSLNQGTLNTGGLVMTPDMLEGTGTINARGLLTSFDLVFDATHGLQQQIHLNSLPGQDITINLDLSDPAMNQGSLGAGYMGSGSMTVADGMAVSSAYGFIGFDNTNPGHDVTGTVTVTGPGSRWDITATRNPYYSPGSFQFYTPLIVGQYTATGILNIDNGGTVSVNGGIYIIGGGSVINLSDGTLDLKGNALRSTSGGKINFTGGVLKHPGYITLQGTGGLFEQLGGTLMPGKSDYPIDSLRIAGDYNLVAGTVEIDFGGAGSPIDSIKVEADGFISTTSTTLKLRPLGSMAPGNYAIMHAEDYVYGGFEFISGLELYEGKYEIIYNSDSVVIRFENGFTPGDLDGDGFIGIDDLNLVLSHWNQNVTPGDWLSGDASGDGFVGIEDLNGVLGNWNAGTPPGEVVPEPGSVALLLAGLLGFTRGRSRGAA